MVAAYSGHWGIVELLLDTDTIDVTRKTTFDRSTLLHQLSLQHQVPLIDKGTQHCFEAKSYILVLSAGADVNAQ